MLVQNNKGARTTNRRQRITRRGKKEFPLNAQGGKGAELRKGLNANLASW